MFMLINKLIIIPTISVTFNMELQWE